MSQFPAAFTSMLQVLAMDIEEKSTACSTVPEFSQFSAGLIQPLYDAVKNRPRLGAMHIYAHRFQAQRGKTWRNLSQRVKGLKVKNSL